MAETVPATDVTVDDLGAARERLRQAEAAVDEYGESDARAVVDAYDDAMDLLSNYEDTATGSGNFAAYVEFQDRFVNLVEELPDEFPTRDAFEEANELLDRRRLATKHFEQAREILSPAREAAEALDEREAARAHLRETKQAVRRRLSTLEEEIEDRERLLALGAADLDAPTEHLRDPIDAYTESVTDAFERFRREESVTDLLDLASTATVYPLVGFTPPPEALRSYLAEAPVGTEPLPTVLEYVGYSRSKLDHYVADASRFRAEVATHETYLRRLDATPLTVGWPPPEAGELRRLAEELVAVVARFADEPVVAQARRVRDLSFRDDYDRLRRSAVAREELSDDERERLSSGAVERELDDLRAERDRLQSALDDTGG
jgi:phage shock protein A